MTPNNVGWMNESNKYVETIKFITKIIGDRDAKE